MKSFAFNPAVPVACPAPGSRLAPVTVARLWSLRTSSRALSNFNHLAGKKLLLSFWHGKLSFSGLFTQLTTVKHDIKQSWFNKVGLKPSCVRKSS